MDAPPATDTELTTGVAVNVWVAVKVLTIQVGITEPPVVKVVLMVV